MCKKEEKKGDTTDKPTTVDGQPDRKDLPVFSINIEKVLLKAVENEEFRNVLFKDRKSALENSGLPLTPQDRMILQSIPAPTLTANLTSLMNSRLTSRRTFLKASAAGFGFLVGSFFAAYFGIPTIESKKIVECTKHIAEIKKALSLYSKDNGGNSETYKSRNKYNVYPPSLDVLTQISPATNKPYLKIIPTCPVGNTPYIYNSYPLKGVTGIYIEDYLDHRYYKKEIHSTFLGQICYKEEKKIAAIKLLFILESIFGIAFSIFWEYNPLHVRFRIQCKNQNLHHGLAIWEAILFTPVMWPTYQLTGGIRS